MCPHCGSPAQAHANREAFYVPRGTQCSRTPCDINCHIMCTGCDCPCHSEDDS